MPSATSKVPLPPSCACVCACVVGVRSEDARECRSAISEREKTENKLIANRGAEEKCSNPVRPHCHNIPKTKIIANKTNAQLLSIDAVAGQSRVVGSVGDNTHRAPGPSRPPLRPSPLLEHRPRKIVPLSKPPLLSTSIRVVRVSRLSINRSAREEEI